MTGETAAQPEQPQAGRLSVRQVNLMVKGTLQQVLPGKLWVVGEIAGIARTKQRNHWYFDLVEKEEGSERIASRLGMVLFAGRKFRVLGELAKAGAGELQDGMRVCLGGALDVYVPSGQYQLMVEDIDPSFTLGDLLRQRRELIAKLQKEGVFHRNKQTVLAPCPLRIGLITSVGSAAYEDFTGTLQRSGYGFRITVVDARMQGEQTGRDVPGALKKLAKANVDAIVICRGGGGVADLSWFDHETIARAIVTCPVPVVAGIGHTTDQSVADMVAHHAAVTPTDAAKFLIEQVAGFEEHLEELAGALVSHTRQRLSEAQLTQTRRLQRLHHRAGEKLHQRALLLSRLAGGLRLGAVRYTSGLQAFLKQAARDLPAQWRGRGKREAERLATATKRLALQGTRNRGFALRQDRFAQVARRLEKALQSYWKSHRKALEANTQVLQAHDPKRRLQQGYALLRGTEGQLLKQRREILLQETVTAEVADGEVSLRPVGRVALFEEE